ncbi:degV family protein [Sanguibacter keddieii DSM 10542]|uniref:DegV family protein n=1 Tax=Sanguibacter keddieii (strain ATCC 51767 / DSM 10542 / NCFB 3025 / ST-74) TaxID=446469 RepID=D1BEI8_SANKS|nr:DegV family protein [Sanguibacter keddieii]ACZ21266.1 degV family protein [Sanguibacter keddieii DSM 10542]
MAGDRTTEAASATADAASGRVVVVTDSTASLPAGLAAAHGVLAVPLVVVVDGVAHHEGVDLGPEGLVAALSRRAEVTTSQPAPEAFLDAYREAARSGASRVVSVHLSGELSGTARAASLAARTSPVPVDVVDSRSVSTGLGLAALAAARVAASGASAAEVVAVAERVAASTTALFVVDSLDHLRRGGRLSAAAAALGTALGLRPVLGLRDGRIEVVQKVRTRGAGADRLVEAAVAALGTCASPRFAVHHLGDDTAAVACALRIEEATGRQVLVSPVSAVLGAHVGPGLLALVSVDDPE